jgi:hypothetical protein
MMLVAIALLGAFAVVATRLIQTTLGLYREAGRVEVEARWIDLASQQLRSDVWSARQITAQGTQSLTIGTTGTSTGTGTDAGGGDVTWQVATDGALVRTAPGPAGDVQRWPEIGARLAFEWDGIALTVRGIDRGVDRAGGIRMISQVKLAEAGGAK